MAVKLISETILLLFLGVAALMDRYTRCIPVWLPLAVLGLGLALNLAAGEGIWGLLLGVVPGLGLLGIGFLSRQAIGYGDGLVFIASGPYLGLSGNLFMMFSALALAAFFSMTALAVKKKKLKESFAFIPFVLTGYICLLLVQSA